MYTRNRIPFRILLFLDKPKCTGSSETPSGKRAKKSKDKEPSEVDAPTSAATGTAGLPQAAPKITASGFVKLSLSDFKINMDVQSTGLPTKSTCHFCSL